ncbi:hypothetical protein D3C81_1595450 [compost metagenome]
MIRFLGDSQLFSSGSAFKAARGLIFKSDGGERLCRFSWRFLFTSRIRLLGDEDVSDVERNSSAISVGVDPQGLIFARIHGKFLGQASR